MSTQPSPEPKIPDDSIEIKWGIILGADVPVEEAERVARLISKHHPVYEINGRILFPVYDNGTEVRTGEHWFSLKQLVKRDELRRIADMPITDWSKPAQGQENRQDSEKETT